MWTKNIHVILRHLFPFVIGTPLVTVVYPLSSHQATICHGFKGSTSASNSGHSGVDTGYSDRVFLWISSDLPGQWRDGISNRAVIIALHIQTFTIIWSELLKQTQTHQTNYENTNTRLFKKNWRHSKMYYWVTKYHMNIKCALNTRTTLNFFQNLELKSFTHFCHHRAPVFIMVTRIIHFWKCWTIF